MKDLELLVICEWHDARTTDREVHRPAWADVERAIRDLDGRVRNDVYLHPDKSDLETYLCIGGGDGRYVVTGAIDNREFPTFVDSARDGLPGQSLVVGGQAGTFPANWIVDLETTLRVVRAFYDARGFVCGISWTNV